MERSAAVVGGGRIGIPMVYELLRLGIPVDAIVERPNLEGENTIDVLIQRMTQDDPAHGQLPWEVKKAGNDVIYSRLIDPEGSKNYLFNRIQVLTPNGPGEIDWKAKGISAVQECTGLCLVINSDGLPAPRYGADAHLNNGADVVIVSAPTTGEDATLIYGINEERYNPGIHRFISNGSCTTKAVAFPLAVLINNGVEIIGNVVANSVHAETGGDLIKLKSSDYQGITGEIKEHPSGAYSALASVFNTDSKLLRGVEAYAHRIPTKNVSVALINLEAQRIYGGYSAEEINEMFRDAAIDPGYRGGIAVYEGKEGLHSAMLLSRNGVIPLFGGIPSAVISPTRTYELGSKGIQIASWYNNEDAPPRNQAGLTHYILSRLG